MWLARWTIIPRGIVVEYAGVRLGANAHFTPGHESYIIEIRSDPHSSPTDNVEGYVDAFQQNTSNWSKYLNNPNDNELANCEYWQVESVHEHFQRVVIFVPELIVTTNEPVQLLVQYRSDGMLV